MSVPTKVVRRKGWVAKINVTEKNLSTFKEDLEDDSFDEDYDVALKRALSYLEDCIEMEQVEFDDVVEDSDYGMGEI